MLVPLAVAFLIAETNICTLSAHRAITMLRVRVSFPLPHHLLSLVLLVKGRFDDVSLLHFHTEEWKTSIGFIGGYALLEFPRFYRIISVLHI